MFDVVKLKFFKNNNSKFFINIISLYILKNQKNFMIILFYINKVYIDCEITLFIFERLIVI